MPLKNHRTFPPGGFQYFQAATGWNARPGATFDEVVTELIAHRAANPRFNLPQDRETVSAELDEYTCIRIANNPEYCMGGIIPKAPLPPPWPARAAGKLGVAVAAGSKVIAGVGVLLDWLGEGAKPVDAGLAETRARICSDCPQNQPGDLTSFFTAPASDIIRKQIEMRREMKMETPYDDRLGVCVACACPMRLKVWTPIEHVAKRLLPESRAKLDPRCWIPKEEQP